MPHAWRRFAAVSAILLLTATFASTIAGPPLTIAATPTVRLSPASGQPGGTLKVSFSAFPKGTTITLAWNGKAMTTTKSSTAGAGSALFTIPAGRKGSHKVTATAGSTSALATFTMVPKLALSSSSTTVGRTLNVTLQGFAKNESIALRWDSSSAKPLATVAASAYGSASAKVVVPPATLGKHKLIGTGSTGSLASASLHVATTVKLKTTSGPPGTNVQVVMRGYSKGEYIEVQWRNSSGTKSLGFATASSTGSVDATVKVPTTATPGSYAIVAVGYAGSVAEAPFKVT